MLGNLKNLVATRNASSSEKRSIRLSPRSSNRRGVVLYYTTVVMVVMFGFCSFAVDLGRVQLAKTELRRAADSAGRAAAAEIPDLASATNFAISYSAKNTADGSPIVLDPATDIEFGKWDTSAAKGHEWTKLGGFAALNANCVHIMLHRTAARGTAVPLLFAKVLGKNTCDINAESYTMIIPPLNVNQYVPATANPFLAGMPRGSEASRINPHNNPDFAGDASNPLESPLAVAMPIDGGESFNFDSISGDARHDPNMAYYSPDGQLNDIGHNNLTTNDANSHGTNNFFNENGLADVNAPINSLVGIFLDDNAPNTSSAPANLDFTSDASRNFTELKPQLKQIFFIGDGLNANGQKQSFVAPKGATRLFLATWDYYEWNNNAGARNIQVSHPSKIITVK